jgi:hypothetical protein
MSLFSICAFLKLAFEKTYLFFCFSHTLPKKSNNISIGGDVLNI